jgi:hypothetical protein
MIGEGRFQTALRRGARVLKDAGLLDLTSLDPEYPNDFPALMRGLSYCDGWKACLDNQWYDHKLLDSSILQFHRTEKTLSYSYLEVPYQAMDFDEFASERLDEDWITVPLSLRTDLEPDLREAYDLYLGSELTEREVTPLQL